MHVLTGFFKEEIFIALLYRCILDLTQVKLFNLMHLNSLYVYCLL